MITTIRKTIEIPPDRHLSLDLPETAPVGKVTMMLSLIEHDEPEQPDTAADPFPTMEELEADAEAKYVAMKESGVDPMIKWRDSLNGKKIFDCDYDYQRSIRDEWDRIPVRH